MLDLYSDFTAMTGQLGINIEILEMCDLKKCYDKVGDKEIQTELDNIKSVFEIGGDGADPRVKKPNEEQLSWSAKIAAAQKIMVSEYNLGALAYYYHGSDGTEYETLQQGFIVGHSLLTANGIPCAGEGDLKTAVAMKICDILGFGGSFCEIVTTDYDKGTILLGHDGPFHIKIAEGKPRLRGMEVYHGKRGTGVSVEAKVRKGPITNIGLTQKADGKLKFIISEGESVDGEIMKIGNTQTHVKFSCEPDAYMDKWFKEAPIHHFAMSVGNNASQFEKIAILLGIEYVII